MNILSGVFPYITVFLASLFHPTDSDLGWHLAYGKYFFENGKVLRENIFSTEMPGFQWVNSSWMTDLTSYLTFNNFGFLGLAILGALTITATFFFFAKAANLDSFQKALIFPIAIYWLSPLNSVSFRGQLLSLLLLGIMVYLLKLHSVILSPTGEESRSFVKTQDRKRVHFRPIYLLPPLFALWSNLHGQFILGLGLFTVWIVSYLALRIWEKRSNLSKTLPVQAFPLLVVFAASAFAVLINPFGIGVYQEAIKHFGDPLQAYVVEWTAISEFSPTWWQQILLGLGVFFTGIFMFFSGNAKEKITNLALFSPVYLISFFVRRFAWPAYYLAFGLLGSVADFFKPDSKKYANLTAVVIFTLYLAGTFIVDSPLKRIQNMSWQSYCATFISCSPEAVTYLNANGLDANLLTYYGWGGYMIYNHSEVKPSIDGRMHLWRDEQGNSAFEEYFAYEQNMENIENSKYDTVLMWRQKPLYKRLEALTESAKWHKVYEDKNAGIFVRIASE